VRHDPALESGAAPWIAASDVLPELMVARFSVRDDVYGAHEFADYIDHKGKKRKAGDRYTAPRCEKHRNADNGLSPGLVWAHLHGRYIVGVHSTSPNNMCKVGALDLDLHPEDEARLTPEECAALRAANWKAAMAWRERLHRLGFRTLLEDSNGKGGLHLWVFFSRLVPSWVVYAFLLWLTADHAAYGLTRAPETRPAQARLSETTPIGNWLRLPGRHPKRPHYSRFWDGERWLDGAEAVAHLIAVLRYGGDDPDLIPQEVRDGAEQAEARAAVERATGKAERGRARGDRADRAAAPTGAADRGGLPQGQKARVVERARRYVARIPGAVSEERGHNKTFHVACVLVRDFMLDRADAEDILAEWNATCSPPWSAAELAHKLDDAEKAGGPLGRLLEGREDGEDADVEISWPTDSTPPAATPPPQRTPEEWRAWYMAEEERIFREQFPGAWKPPPPLSPAEQEKLEKEREEEQAAWEAENPPEVLARRAEVERRAAATSDGARADGCGRRKVGTRRSAPDRAKRARTRCKKPFGCGHCREKNAEAERRNMLKVLSREKRLWVGTLPPQDAVALTKRLRRTGGACRHFASDVGYKTVANRPFATGGWPGAPVAKEVDVLTALEYVFDAIDNIPKDRPAWLTKSVVVLWDEPVLHCGVVAGDLAPRLAQRVRRRGYSHRAVPRADGTVTFLANCRFPVTWERVPALTKRGKATTEEVVTAWSEEKEPLAAARLAYDAMPDDDDRPESFEEFLRKKGAVVRRHKAVFGSEEWSIPEPAEGDFCALGDDPLPREGDLLALMAEVGLQVRILGPDEVPGLDGMDVARLPRTGGRPDDRALKGEREQLAMLVNLMAWGEARKWDLILPREKPSLDRSPRVFDIPVTLTGCVLTVGDPDHGWHKRRLDAFVAKLERSRKRHAERQARRRRREEKERRWAARRAGVTVLGAGGGGPKTVTPAPGQPGGP
jgi:hypothetical protein